MNDICKYLITSFCQEKCGMRLDSGELEFLTNFDWSPFPFIYVDDSDKRVVDGKEGRCFNKRYYMDDTKKVLLVETENYGDGDIDWKFKPLFVTCISVVVMQMFGERLRNLATHDDEDTSITRTIPDDKNSITRTTQ